MTKPEKYPAHHHVYNQPESMRCPICGVTGVTGYMIKGGPRIIMKNIRRKARWMYRA